MLNNISKVIGVLLTALLLMGCKEDLKSSKASPSVKSATTSQSELPKIKEWLQSGGNLVIIRHAQKFEEGADAREARSAFDAADASLKQPITVPLKYQNGSGMCLTQVGKATAWLQGEIFRRGDFKVGKVLASATCRTRQHADIMFEGDFEIDQDLIFGGITMTDKIETTHAAKKELFAQADLSENLVVIGHGKTAYESGLVDFWPAQAEMLIFRRGNNNGDLELVGHLDTKLMVHMLEEREFTDD